MKQRRLENASEENFPGRSFQAKREGVEPARKPHIKPRHERTSQDEISAASRRKALVEMCTKESIIKKVTGDVTEKRPRPESSDRLKRTTNTDSCTAESFSVLVKRACKRVS